MLRVDGKRLVYHYDAEELWIEAWGKNAVRVRATKQSKMPDDDWALTISHDEEAEIEIGEDGAVLKNGALELNVSKAGKIIICNEKTKLF